MAGQSELWRQGEVPPQALGSEVQGCDLLSIPAAQCGAALVSAVAQGLCGPELGQDQGALRELMAMTATAANQGSGPSVGARPFPNFSPAHLSTPGRAQVLLSPGLSAAAQERAAALVRQGALRVPWRGLDLTVPVAAHNILDRPYDVVLIISQFPGHWGYRGVTAVLLRAAGYRVSVQPGAPWPGATVVGEQLGEAAAPGGALLTDVPVGNRLVAYVQTPPHDPTLSLLPRRFEWGGGRWSTIQVLAAHVDLLTTPTSPDYGVAPNPGLGAPASGPPAPSVGSPTAARGAVPGVDTGSGQCGDGGGGGAGAPSGQPSAAAVPPLADSGLPPHPTGPGGTQDTTPTAMAGPAPAAGLGQVDPPVRRSMRVVLESDDDRSPSPRPPPSAPPGQPAPPGAGLGGASAAPPPASSNMPAIPAATPPPRAGGDPTYGRPWGPAGAARVRACALGPAREAVTGQRHPGPHHP